MIDQKDSAQLKLREIKISPGDRFRHYKGGEYEVVTCALKEDTLEPLIIYRSLSNNSTWARTLQNWSEHVKINGTTLPRFKKIT